jgi:hypothetical protein
MITNPRDCATLLSPITSSELRRHATQHTPHWTSFAKLPGSIRQQQQPGQRLLRSNGMTRGRIQDWQLVISAVISVRVPETPRTNPFLCLANAEFKKFLGSHVVTRAAYARQICCGNRSVVPQRHPAIAVTIFRLLAQFSWT